MDIYWISDREERGNHLVEVWKNEELVFQDLLDVEPTPMLFCLSDLCLVYRGYFQEEKLDIIEIWFKNERYETMDDINFPFGPPCPMCPDFGQQEDWERESIYYIAMSYVDKR